MKELVLMEVGRKQGYIFKSNRLRENIGASQIIQYVTEELPNNILNKFNGQAIMNGGGKSLYSFSNEDESVKFIKTVSEEIIKRFPGLDVYFVRDQVDLSQHILTEKIENLYVKLGIKKALKASSMKQVSLGIEKICKSTGLPAAYYEKDEVLSEEINSKRKFYNNSLRGTIVKGKDKLFPRILDEIKDDEKSYIAVIHIDGNSMGSKFVELSNYFRELINKDKCNNVKYLEAMSELSTKIDNIYKFAFNKIVDLSIDEKGISTIRPIILAGDDVTFVCRPEDAIKFSKIFVEELNKNFVKIGKDDVQLNAAVGIAFVKSHYPFSRAYDLAEELCSNCKVILKKLGKDKSMIDWHILQGESSDCIQEIRNEQYTVNVDEQSLKLSMRPIYINDKEAFNNIDNFNATLKVVHSNKISRNKIKALRGELTKGINSAKVYMDYYRIKDQFEWFNEEKAEYGIYNNTAVFFDAIEIMDLVKEV